MNKVMFDDVAQLVCTKLTQDLIKTAKENMSPGVVENVKRLIACVLFDISYDQVTDENIKELEEVSYEKDRF